MTAPDSAPCRFCEALAYTGRHEPYLVDDLDARLRLWRCTRCATLWLVTERAVVPTSPDRADSLLPGWRERERWLMTTSLPELLAEAASGTIDDDLLALAVLHHDLFVGPGTPQGTGYTSDSTAVLDGVSHELRAVSVARWMRRVPSAVFDPAGPYPSVMTAEQQFYLDHVGGGTVTEADRRRDEETDA